MNIKNRLEQLESRIIRDKFEFCVCFDLKLKQVIERIYNDKTTMAAKVLTAGESLETVCGECRKPLRDITREVCANLQTIYG